MCQVMTFSRIPKDSSKLRALRKQWLNEIPRTNTPTSSHSCVSSVYFVGGVCHSRKNDVPQIFERQPVLASERSTRASRGHDFSVAETSPTTSEAAADAPQHEEIVAESSPLPTGSCVA